MGNMDVGSSSTSGINYLDARHVSTPTLLASTGLFILIQIIFLLCACCCSCFSSCAGYGLPYRRQKRQSPTPTGALTHNFQLRSNNLLEQDTYNLSLSLKNLAMNQITIILILAIRQSPHLLPIIMAYHLYKAHQSQPNQQQKLLIAKQISDIISKK